MKRIALTLVIGAAILAFAAGCRLNAPLDACFTVLPDPDGQPLTRQFNAACSTYCGEPLGVGYIYEWHFGDGPRIREHSNALTTYAFPEPGEFRVELLIIGWDGEFARTSRWVLVEEP